MLDGQVFLPIVRKRFVEFPIFFLTNIIWISCPNGLGFVKFLIFGVFFLNCLFPFFLLLVLVSILVFPHVLYFRLFVSFFFIIHLLISFIIRHFLVAFFLD